MSDLQLTSSKERGSKCHNHQGLHQATKLNKPAGGRFPRCLREGSLANTSTDLVEP